MLRLYIHLWVRPFLLDLLKESSHSYIADKAALAVHAKQAAGEIVTFLAKHPLPRIFRHSDTPLPYILRNGLSKSHPSIPQSYIQGGQRPALHRRVFFSLLSLVPRFIAIPGDHALPCGILALKRNTCNILSLAITSPSTMVLPLFQHVKYTPWTEKPWRRRPNYVLLLRCLSVALLGVILLITGIHFHDLKRTLSTPSLSDVAGGSEISPPEVPKDFQTVGVVFYGRRSSVEILECYLRVIQRTQLSSRLTADAFSETSKKMVGSWMKYYLWLGRATRMTWSGLSG